ncbi:MAG: hypothetical protein EOO65_00760 [Methanosarcinales archaeon]|nr:MAG: hypothetical protein EOO65_00760 [Methanosarcinales archaeon]
MLLTLIPSLLQSMVEQALLQAMPQLLVRAMLAQQGALCTNAHTDCAQLHAGLSSPLLSSHHKLTTAL